MRYFGKLLFLAAAFCCVALAAEPSKVKVGFYIENGSLGCGVLYWARILHFSPQLEVTLVNGKDIRDGKLKGLDLLMVPGGSSSKQCKALGEAGMAEIRRYVADGGAYLGVCAGYHCALRGKERIGLFTYRRRENGYGGLAPLRVELTGNAETLLGIPAGNYNVRYAHGPIVRSSPDTAPSAVPAKTEVIGVYRASVSPAGQPGFNFFGAPAMLFGTYGKGKVVATSCHPESRTASWPIALGCVYAATGVRPTPQLPVKVYRPIRVGYLAPSVITKKRIREVVELDRDREIDLHFVDPNALEEGILSHLDVMIYPEGMKNLDKMSAWRKRILVEFMERGGKLLAAASFAADMPQHRNLRTFAATESLVAATKASNGEK